MLLFARIRTSVTTSREFDSYIESAGQGALAKLGAFDSPFARDVGGESGSGRNVERRLL